MRDDIRGQLAKEISRKQFLQYMSAAALSIFGINNLLSLITGGKRHHTTIVIGGDSSNNRHGFGSSKFGAS